MSYRTPTKQYILNGDRLDILDWPDISRGAHQLGTMTVEHQQSCSYAVADTYEATILASGHLLIRNNEGNQLIAYSDLLPLIKHETRQESEATPLTCFGRVLSASPYRSKYHEGWKLLPQGKLQIDTTEYMCRNSLGKGIARLWLVKLCAKQQVQLIYFEPLRGYEQEAKSYYLFFRHGAGLSPASANRYPFHTALGLHAPLLTDGNVDLDQSATLILRRRLQVYAAESFRQIDGIIQDADPECLHKFRVELRKMRSLVSLFKPLLTSYHVELKSVLNSLMEKTNALRDLDVLLESRKEYLRMAIANSDSHSASITRKGLRALFKRIAIRRSNELADVSNWLESETVDGNTRRSLQLLSSRSPIWKRSSRNKRMNIVLSQRIIKAYTSVKTATLALTPAAVPAEIHRLRILHKRLRYLLEFSLDLEASTTSESLLGIMKNCQKHLGNYNDAEVQLDWFRTWADSLAGDLTVPEKNAMTSLIQTIESHGAELRVQAIEHASECISPATEVLLQSLAHPEGAE